MVREGTGAPKLQLCCSLTRVLVAGLASLDRPRKRGGTVVSNILKIYLDQGNAVVDERGTTICGKDRLKRSQSAQTITWKLTSNAYKGSIKSFAWKPPYAPAGTFGPPALTP